MLNLFRVFAISILVPTPSVQATILGCFILFGISDIAPKPPILENFFLPFFFVETDEMKCPCCKRKLSIRKRHNYARRKIRA